MIIIDLSQIFISTISATGGVEHPDKDQFRHYLLNTVKSYKKLFQLKYGKEIVLAVDGHGTSWRRSMFPSYKYERRTSRNKSKTDWKLIFKIYGELLEEIKLHVPVIVIEHSKCEADDVISVLVRDNIEKEKLTLIVSGDKDFIQLLDHEYVRQFSPLTKQWISHENPSSFLKEHIIRGDSSDGIPNIYTEDDFFKDRIDKGLKTRQKAIRKTDLIEWLPAPSDEFCKSNEMMMYYERNKRLIDLRMIPLNLQKEILDQYNTYKIPDGKGLFFHLASNGATKLVADINNFF